MKKIYLIGSLRNPEVPKLAIYLRSLGFEVFDDWFAAGPIADDSWQEYEKGKGSTYDQALKGLACNHVFDFDHKHLDLSDIAVLVLPAGKSGHLELGYCIGKGKPGFILFDKEPERWDAMYRFADGVFFKQEDLAEALKVHL